MFKYKTVWGTNTLKGIKKAETLQSKGWKPISTGHNFIILEFANSTKGV